MKNGRNTVNDEGFSLRPRPLASLREKAEINHVVIVSGTTFDNFTGSQFSVIKSSQIQVSGNSFRTLIGALPPPLEVKSKAIISEAIPVGAPEPPQPPCPPRPFDSPLSTAYFLGPPPDDSLFFHSVEKLKKFVIIHGQHYSETDKPYSGHISLHW
jgi:hypothetical protein